MKQLVLFFGLLLIILPCSAETPEKLPAPEVVKINQRVYALLGPAELPAPSNRGYMVNSTIIIGDRGVILIDTGFTDEIGRHLKTVIAGITSKPVTHVINTHNHGDHTLGNSEFQGATVISSEKCKTAVAQSSHEWIALVENMTGLKFPNIRPVPATTTYAENTKTAVTLQGVRLVLWVPPGSHTPTDLMVHLPDDKVLVAGDIVVNTMMPNFRDGHVRTWITTLEEISKLPVTTVIPGHGALMSTAGVAKMQQAMQSMYRATEAGYKQGLMASEIRKTMDLGYWQQRKYFDELMGGNISRTYLEVEDANF